MQSFIHAAIALVISTSTIAARAETCVASYYHEGQMTASGERFNPRAATCAHKTHRMGTVLRVTRIDTGASVFCRVNDRGPFIRGRCIDLSLHGADALNMRRSGTARVTVEAVR